MNAACLLIGCITFQSGPERARKNVFSSFCTRRSVGKKRGVVIYQISCRVVLLFECIFYALLIGVRLQAYIVAFVIIVTGIIVIIVIINTDL